MPLVIVEVLYLYVAVVPKSPGYAFVAAHVDWTPSRTIRSVIVGDEASKSSMKARLAAAPPVKMRAAPARTKPTMARLTPRRAAVPIGRRILEKPTITALPSFCELLCKLLKSSGRSSEEPI